VKKSVLVLTVVLLSGCLSSTPKEDMRYDLGDAYAPLEAIRVKPVNIGSDSAITTVGRYCYVSDLEEWLVKHPPGSRNFHAIMLHEQVHSQRQHDYGVFSWVSRYLYDTDFMWAEEQIGYYYQFKLEGVPNILRRAVILAGYENLRGKMVSVEEAETWIRAVLRGQWTPPE